MNIVVLVKQVPDTAAERALSGADHTLDRENTDLVLDEINECAAEEALTLKEATDAEVTVDVAALPARTRSTSATVRTAAARTLAVVTTSAP